MNHGWREMNGTIGYRPIGLLIEAAPEMCWPCACSRHAACKGGDCKCLPTHGHGREMTLTDEMTLRVALNLRTISENSIEAAW